MHYSDNAGSVKVEFFKPGGKWYMTEAWDMSKFYLENLGPVEAVRKMLQADERGARLLAEFVIVVTDPYHRHAFPVMLVP